MHKILADEIPHCTICDIQTEKPEIENFDSIILGAGVRDGKYISPFAILSKITKNCWERKWATLFAMKTKGNRRNNSAEYPR